MEASSNTTLMLVGWSMEVCLSPEASPLLERLRRGNSWVAVVVVVVDGDAGASTPVFSAASRYQSNQSPWWVFYWAASREQRLNTDQGTKTHKKEPI